MERDITATPDAMGLPTMHRCSNISVTAYYEQVTLTGTAETGKSIETLRFAEMLSSFAQIPGDVDSTA